MGDPQESSRERKREHEEAVESILDSVDPALEEHAYPVNSEDLSAQYGETVLELPNETESLGSVFDRLEDDEYDSAMEVKEAVLRSVSEASPDPTVAGADREPQPGAQGAPEEVREDLESDELAASTAPGTPTDVESEARSASERASGERSEPRAEEAADVARSPAKVSDPEADAAEPGDQLTPETTEDDEFAPGEAVEERDRESDGRAAAERTSGEPGTWEGAAEEPGDPAEPTAEPTEEELDPEERAGRRGEEETPDVEEGVEASERDDGASAEDVDVDYEEVVDEGDESEQDVSSEGGRDESGG